MSNVITWQPMVIDGSVDEYLNLIILLPLTIFCVYASRVWGSSLCCMSGDAFPIINKLFAYSFNSSLKVSKFIAIEEYSLYNTYGFCFLTKDSDQAAQCRKVKCYQSDRGSLSINNFREDKYQN
jgi:hypothetical protein